ALTLVSAESGRRFGRAHLAHAEEVARRAALAVDNARLYREAQTAIREREVILSVASHELKNPLTALMGYARLLDSRAAVGRPMSERDVRGVRTIAEQGERLNQMLDLLLDIARIESGRLRLEQAPVDLGELIQRMVAEIEPGLNQHTINYQPPDAPLIVHGDTVRLEQVFRNLLNNAVKYSPQGGIVEARVERQDSSVLVAVRDEGIGIASDALPYLFQRFYRAPQEDVQQLGGLGVGLYVVREIVTLHGGSVDVASAEGEGSTFTVALPLHQQEPEQSGDA
ncbi:MAG TPA: ATP-binding protein, partial [Herpetosiphonaceae bacterium]|nr:ATP-binding protein [Herpetosiphonaceae bacterium]